MEPSDVRASRPLDKLLALAGEGEQPAITGDDLVSCGKYSKALFEEVLVGAPPLGLYTWGKTTNLTLGYGQFSHSAAQDRARRVALPNGEVPSSVVSCSAFHTVCVCESGHVAVWGFGQGYRLGVGDDQSKVDPVIIDPAKFLGVPIVKAQASVDNTMLLDAEGGVYVTGSNRFGQCGRSKHWEVCKAPTILKHLVGPCSDIAAGDKHCIAVDAGSQQVLAWGDNSAGQLGVDFTQGSVDPQVVSRLKGVGKVFANGTLSAALRGNGSELYIWGGGACPLPTRVRVEATSGEGKVDNGWTVQAISGAVFVSVALPRGSNRVVLLSALGDLYTVDMPSVKDAKAQGGHSLVARFAHHFGPDITAHSVCIYGEQCLVQLEDGRVLASRLRDLTEWTDAGAEVGVAQAVAIGGSPAHAIALVRANLPDIPAPLPGRVPGLQETAQRKLAVSSIHSWSIVRLAWELCVLDSLQCGFVRFPLLVDYCLVMLLTNLPLLYAQSPDALLKLLKCLSPLLRLVADRKEHAQLSLFHRGAFDRPSDILDRLLDSEDFVRHMEEFIEADFYGEDGTAGMQEQINVDEPAEGRPRTNSTSRVGGSLESLEARQQKRLKKVLREQEKVLVAGEATRKPSSSGEHQWKEVQTGHPKAPPKSGPPPPVPMSPRRSIEPAAAVTVVSPRRRTSSGVSDSGPQPRTPTLGDFIFSTGPSRESTSSRSCPWAKSPPKQGESLSKVLQEQRLAAAAASSSSSSSSSFRHVSDRCSWGMDATPGARRASAMAAVIEEEREAQEAIRLVEEFERSEREARRLAAMEEAAGLGREGRGDERSGGHGRRGNSGGKGKGNRRGGRWEGGNRRKAAAAAQKV